MTRRQQKPEMGEDEEFLVLFEDLPGGAQELPGVADSAEHDARLVHEDEM